jgi:hypothetical protein
MYVVYYQAGKRHMLRVLNCTLLLSVGECEGARMIGGEVGPIGSINCAVMLRGSVGGAIRGVFWVA